MPRAPRPSRLIPQQPARKKQSILGRSQPRNAKRRRREGKRVWPGLVWFTAGLAGMAGIGLGLVLLYYQLLTSPFFCIKDINNIEVTGTQRFTRSQILEMAHLDARTNLLALKPNLVEQTLMTHPWIARAELSRHWPNHITLRLTERIPVALVQLEDLYYIDKNGMLFKPSSPSDPHDFPVITGLSRAQFPAGQGSPSMIVSQTLDLLKFLQDNPGPLKSSLVAEINVDPERGFTLYLSGVKTAFFLGSTNLPEKIGTLTRVWPFLAQSGYLARAGRINLDHPQRLLLSLREVNTSN
jgi:cell division septal protein FtsQ